MSLVSAILALSIISAVDVSFTSIEISDRMPHPHKIMPPVFVDGGTPTDSVHLRIIGTEKDSVSKLNVRDHPELSSALHNAPPNPPKNLTAASATYLFISLRWGLPDRWVTTDVFTLEWSADNITWEVLAERILGTAGSGGFYGHSSNLLTPGSTFYYRVKTVNSKDEESGFSNVFSVTAPARSGTDFPTNVTATKQSASSIRVSWSKPAGVGTRGYALYGSDDAGTFLKLIAGTFLSPITGTQYTASGLESNTCYGFRVIHLASDLSASDFSDEAYATTGTVVVPAAPTGFMAEGDGSTTFNLSWTAPTSDKCSAITGYQIQQRTDGNWTDVVADTGDDATTYAHTGGG